jgi:hypothetical protein
MKNFLRNTRRGWMIFSEADKGGAPGGGSTQQDQKPQEPTGGTIELKLESSKKIAADYHKQLSGAMSERETAQQDLKKEQDAHGATRDLLKKEQDAHAETKGLLKKEQDAAAGANQRADKAEAHRKLLESYAKHHNLDLAGLEKFQAAKTPEGAGPETGGNAEGKALHDQYEVLKKDPKKSKQATAFFRKHKAELREYANSLKD